LSLAGDRLAAIYLSGYTVEMGDHSGSRVLVADGVEEETAIAQGMFGSLTVQVRWHVRPIHVKITTESASVPIIRVPCGRSKS
jgi:hypothetical protein